MSEIFLGPSSIRLLPDNKRTKPACQTWSVSDGSSTLEATMLGTLSPLLVLELTTRDGVVTVRGRGWCEVWHRLVGRCSYRMRVALEDLSAGRSVAA